jgi:hypothetical protein
LRRHFRLAGVFTFLIGLVAVVVGTFNGCGSLFTFNGRHVVGSRAIDRTDGPIHQPLLPTAGRRYTLAVQVVFDREDLPRDEGLVRVEARMPLVVQVKDGTGRALTQVSGWLDPNEPPNVLYGQAAHESTRGPMPDLLVERLVGPFIATSSDPISIDVEIGPDRVGSAQITSRRLVVHDDALPASIRNAFIVAATGSAVLFAGVVLIGVGFFAKRFRSTRKDGARKRVVIPRPDVV